MDKNKLKDDMKNLGILFVIMIIMFKIAFSRESFVVVIKVVAGIFWIMILPGFFITYNAFCKLRFLERIAAGILVGTSLTVITIYTLGWFGIKMKLLAMIIPIMLVGLGLFFSQKKG